MGLTLKMIRRFFDSQNNRLVYFGMKPDKAMWENRWAEENIEKIFSRTKLNSTDRMIIETTQRYLPQGSRVLEGGCGLGGNVKLLQDAGFEVIGVDFAEQTIQRVQRFMPEIDVRHGDLRKLGFNSGYFDGYWSFGVIEHFYDGFDDILSEMKYVLKLGGYLFITVPSLSQLRKIKTKLGMYPKFIDFKKGEDEFYQFAYSSEEIEESFCSHGFMLVQKYGWSVYKGISDEIPGTRLIMRVLCNFFEVQMERILGGFANHMWLFVFKRNG